ncbi:MAG: hypothetical protein C0594_07245 [Marinilabiliales bacterium]|nr:MAG: hypothetical protein C0594_07245 [Marinilabiliales bacterium]
MKKSLVILMLLGFIVSVNAQIDSTQQYLPITISYYGDLYTHPGLKLSTEYVLGERVIEKKRSKGRVKVRHKQYVPKLSLTYTHHAAYYNAFLLGGEMNFRKLKPSSGFRVDKILGMGYMRAFNAGKTYEVDDNMNISKVPLAGHNQFFMSFAFGFSKLFVETKQIPLAWHIRQSFTVYMPNNGAFGGILGFEVGVSYFPTFKKKNNEK